MSTAPTSSDTSLRSRLSLEDFFFDFPDELVAQSPVDKRSHSRLLQRTSDGRITHHQFKELSEILPEDSILIINDSKVFPSRLIGQLDSGGKIEIFLLGEPQVHEQGLTLKAIGKPMKKLKAGLRLRFAGGLDFDILAKDSKTSPPTLKLNCQKSLDDFFSILDSHGYIPLPPYIERAEPKPAAKSQDKTRYQTVYSQTKGSVAAPTAGLHFDNKVMTDLKDKGIRFAPITLHVGAGTFLPVKSSDVSQHAMHRERFIVPKSSFELIKSGRQQGKKIICVGTTSFRCLEGFKRIVEENSASEDDYLDRFLSTGIFIYPKSKKDRYKASYCDAIITNFHQPGSTLIMLISALIGYENTKALYKQAVEKRYRLFSYGDSSLLWF